MFLLRLLAPIGRFWVPFLTPSDFEGGSQIDHLKKNIEKQMRKKHIFLYVRRFPPQKKEGSTAQRLPMFFDKKMIKRLYKTEHKETQPKQQMSQSPSKNDLSKATVSQQHINYYGFVKTRVANVPLGN